MNLPAPTLLGGRYELRGLLGQGGMAEVHRGHDRRLGREVAVKILHGTVAGDVERQRFASEARLLAGLNHRNLVVLLDAGLDDPAGGSRPWLVMELVPGPTLADRLAEARLGPEEVAAIGADLAAALAHVHAQGVVHRDVKPANVLLGAAGGAKLADFGVARLMDEQTGYTSTGSVIGTAAYLAPEQVQGQPASGAADVYALGLVLLEALTGRRAYRGTPTEAALARLHASPVIPVSLGPGWVRLLDAMTAREPAERPDPEEVVARLAVLSGAAAPTPVASPVATATGPVVPLPPAGRRRPRLGMRAGLAAALLLVLAAGTAWVSAGTGSAPPAADAADSAGVSGRPAAAQPDRQRKVTTVGNRTAHQAAARPTAEDRREHRSAKPEPPKVHKKGPGRAHVKKVKGPPKHAHAGPGGKHSGKPGKGPGRHRGKGPGGR